MRRCSLTWLFNIKNPFKEYLEPIPLNYCLPLEYRMNLKDAKYDEICVPDKFLSYKQQKRTLAN